MTKKLPALALVVSAALFAIACEKKDAGEKLDEAYTDALEKAEEAGKQMEEAGEKIEEALEEAEKAVNSD